MRLSQEVDHVIMSGGSTLVPHLPLQLYVRFDLFLCEVQVENTANLRSGRNNFVVRTQEVVQPRPEISPDLTADIRPPISFLVCEERV